MKLLRLKITDPEGFRSLPCEFEHHFRSEWALQEELGNTEGFAPFVCAGRNGSGKSNLLEVLGAIFYHLESLYLENRPDSFDYDVQSNPGGFEGRRARPDGFEIEYVIASPKELNTKNRQVRIKISKEKEVSPKWWILAEASNKWKKLEDFEKEREISLGRVLRRKLLPEYVIGYSSGENEILSLPFFKARFIQFDEYWQTLVMQEIYNNEPEARLIFLDNSFSQAILLSNLLLQDENTLRPFSENIGIEALLEFRIILCRSILLTREQLESIVNINESQQQTLESIINEHPALRVEEDELGNTRYRLNLLYLLEGDEKSSRIISKLRRCATLCYEDDSSDALILDYWVNDATKKAFRENFQDFENPVNSARLLFQAFQVLLTLNLYTVSSQLKSDLYQSNSHYVSETVPTLASDERIMRFKFVRFRKRGMDDSMMLKELSDGEHQLLHSLGLCLLFRNTNSLFLMDEPETHFNPDWRANFISHLRQCFNAEASSVQEMLITTHTPFLISDSEREKVLVFSNDETSQKVVIKHPEYNTLGASINLITMETFNKQETIGMYAQQILQHLLSSEFKEKDPHELAKLIIATLGDSIERSMAIQEVLARGEQSKNPDKAE